MDTISRQAVIDAITQIKRTDNWKAAVCMVVYELPSTQPVNYGSTNLIDKNEVLDAIHKVIFSIIDTKSPLTVIDKQLLSINKAITTKIKELPSAQPEISRIEQELHGKTPEEQYEFLYWLLLKFGLAYTDSRLAVIEWLRGEK